MNIHKVRYNKCNSSPQFICNNDSNPQLGAAFHTNKLGPYLGGLLESDGYTYMLLLVSEKIREERGENLIQKKVS